MTPPAAGNGRIQRERRGDRLFFTVRDLIACRFHYLCTNVTFSSDQGAQQPLAGRMANCQAIVQKAFSQSELPGQAEVRGGRKVHSTPKILKQRAENKAADAAHFRRRATGCRC